MTHQQWINCIVACLIGNVIHIIFKMISLAKDHKSERKMNADFPEFDWKKYIKDDKWALIGDLVGSFAMVYLADEWLGTFGNYFMEKLKTVFVFVGMGGSFVITHLFGAAKDKFRKTVQEYRNTQNNSK